MPLRSESERTSAIGTGERPQAARKVRQHTEIKRDHFEFGSFGRIACEHRGADDLVVGENPANGMAA